MGGARDRHPSLEGREEGSEARARSYQAARLGRPGSARQALHYECAKNANNSNSSRDSGVYPAGAAGFGQNVTAGRQTPGRSLSCDLKNMVDLEQPIEAISKCHELEAAKQLKRKANPLTLEP